ncbi:MAG: hypothetical protein EX272_01490 [Chromatiales bacterium]|nr:MAG: hypothetical protein EX272_01490 [Chromatiales bacterium]
MSDTSNLPAEVVNAILAGRKIEAIKLLREARGIGLKEAKHAVDAYIRENPSAQQRRPSGGGLVIIVVVAILGYAIYKTLG